MDGNGSNNSNNMSDNYERYQKYAQQIDAILEDDYMCDNINEKALEKLIKAQNEFLIVCGDCDIVRNKDTLCYRCYADSVSRCVVCNELVCEHHSTACKNCFGYVCHHETTLSFKYNHSTGETVCKKCGK